MVKKRIVVTGASGYVAGQMLPTLREKYDTVLLDASPTTSPERPHPQNRDVKDVIVTDLVDPDRTKYQHYFEGADAVVHLGYIRRRENEDIDQYTSQRENVDMAYNVLRTAYETGVPRVVSASSNHASDWHERELIHKRAIETLDPYALPLSNNFYGWSKATYEHLGFIFASGVFGRKMGVVMVRIGSPAEINFSPGTDPGNYKRGLGSYVSKRDLTQLFVKAIETPNISNEHNVPWLVVYGISDNTRGFWSIANARRVLGYKPQDDSEVKFADDIRRVLVGENKIAGPGRLGI